MGHPSLSKLLRSGRFPAVASKGAYERRQEDLQQRMLRIQQGLFHTGGRAVIAFEGFDAAGKGGAIRRLTEKIDPRGVRVVPVGPPAPDEQGRHWLWRFWRELPVPGTLTIFDRSWYGRVLVERVEGLAPEVAWRRAYREIVEFERMLVDDGVELVKVFLAVSKGEQLRRFRERLENPYKQWKISGADIEARRRWDGYVEATDDALARTDTARARWRLVPADHKWFARLEVLRVVTTALGHHARWMEKKSFRRQAKQLARELAKLER